MDTHITAVTAVDQAELMDLYSSVGWGAYTRDPEGLAAAISNSTYVVTARVDGELVGLARGLSDDVSIFYLQDILVHPDRRRQGIGQLLLQECLRRFDHVRGKVLLTDGDEAQHGFYNAMGYSNTRLIENEDLHAFVRMDGLDLETRDESSSST